MRTNEIDDCPRLWADLPIDLSSLPVKLAGVEMTPSQAEEALQRGYVAVEEHQRAHHAKAKRFANFEENTL